MTYIPQPATGQYADLPLRYWIELKVDFPFGTGKSTVYDIKDWLTANVGEEHVSWELLWAFNLLTQHHGFNVMVGDLKTLMYFKLAWSDYAL